MNKGDLKPEKPVKDDRLVTTEMESYKARLDAKLALELTLLTTELIDLLATSVDSDSRESAIYELQAKRLVVMQAVTDQLRTDYLTRLSERSQHVVNFQSLQPDLESQSSDIAGKRLALVRKMLLRKNRSTGLGNVAEAVTPTTAVSLGVKPTGVVSSGMNATVASGSVIESVVVVPVISVTTETTVVDITETKVEQTMVNGASEGVAVIDGEADDEPP